MTLGYHSDTITATISRNPTEIDARANLVFLMGKAIFKVLKFALGPLQTSRKDRTHVIR